MGKPGAENDINVMGVTAWMRGGLTELPSASRGRVPGTMRASSGKAAAARVTRSRAPQSIVVHSCGTPTALISFPIVTPASGICFIFCVAS